MVAVVVVEGSDQEDGGYRQLAYLEHISPDDDPLGIVILRMQLLIATAAEERLWVKAVRG